jgi:cell wall-associated NlpC family hydrolase
MAAPSQGPQILTAAQAANTRVAATPYRLGGKSEIAGLDCSYFVYLVLHAVDPPTNTCRRT